MEERVRQFRARNGGVTKEVIKDVAEEGAEEVTQDVTKRYKRCNEEAGVTSTSTSLSNSDSGSSEEEGVQGEEEPRPLPVSPVEAMLHPDVRVFARVTGGRIPGLSQYRAVIDAVRFLRVREKLDDARLGVYLAPYWLAWSSRKRQDGRPYDPGNISWLTEWALNGSIPPPGVLRGTELARPPVPSPEETRKMLAEKDEKLKNTVPPPKVVQAKIRGLTGKLAGKDAP